MDSVFRLLSHDKRGYPVGSKLLLTLRPYAYGEDVYMDDISGNLGEDVVVEWRERYGEDVPIVAYMIPEDMQAEMFAIFGEGLWFDAEGTAKQVNIIELAQSPEINQLAVWYRLDAAAGLGYREVLFYHPDLITVADVTKIASWFKEDPELYFKPSAFFNGMDFRLATYTGGPTYAADNLGVLRSPGSNLPAVQGMRLATTVADGAVLGPELAVSGALVFNYNGYGNSFESITSNHVTNSLSLGVIGVLLPVGKYKVSIVKSNITVGNVENLYFRRGNSSIVDLSVQVFTDGYIDITDTYSYIVLAANALYSSDVTISIKLVIPTYVTTDSSGNPIVTSTPQKTVTYSTDRTAKTFAETFDKFDISDPLKAPGWLCEPVRTNYALNSATPATHTTGTIPIGTYTLWQEGTGSFVATAGTAVGTFGTASNGTPATITITTAGTVVLTASGINTWVQLELGAFKTSRIYTTSAPMVRAAAIASFPTAGKIPVNDFAIRMIVVPRASGQSGVWMFSSYVDYNNYTGIFIAPDYIIARKRIAGVSTDVSVTYSHSNNTPFDVLIYSSSEHGVQLSVRQFSSSWGSFTNSTANISTAAKANVQLASTYQLGALNGSSQFTGNISLFDCVPIPSGTTDPMAWAKTHWGVA